MKVYTYAELSNKILKDQDLADETFLDAQELAGHFNTAIEEAENEINTLTFSNYFKTFTYLPIVTGSSTFRLPHNIFIDKIRKMMYRNGAIIYPIVAIKPHYEFEDIEFTEFYGVADPYRFTFVNPQAGASRIKFVPVARETAILPPTYAYPDALNPDYGGTFPNFFAPVRVWYLRSAQRMPIPTLAGVQGELRFTESLICSLTGSAFSAVNTGTNAIATLCGQTHNDGFTPFVPGGLPYITGDILYFTPEPGGVLPSPLVKGTPYYVIAGASGSIQLAASATLAAANTPLVLTTTGTGFVDVQVVTTQTILNALLVDIPHFSEFIMAWVKKLCLEKDIGDPRYAIAEAKAEKQRKQMQDTLAEMFPDLENEIEPDFSHYQEMS